VRAHVGESAILPPLDGVPEAFCSPSADPPALAVNPCSVNVRTGRDSSRRDGFARCGRKQRCCLDARRSQNSRSKKCTQGTLAWVMTHLCQRSPPLDSTVATQNFPMLMSSTACCCITPSTSSLTESSHEVWWHARRERQLHALHFGHGRAVFAWKFRESIPRSGPGLRVVNCGVISNVSESPGTSAFRDRASDYVRSGSYRQPRAPDTPSPKFRESLPFPPPPGAKKHPFWTHRTGRRLAQSALIHRFPQELHQQPGGQHSRNPGGRRLCGRTQF
jgi:hypothetical protein